MAAGADQAFYRGARAHGAFELYLPWPSLRGRCSLARPRLAQQLRPRPADPGRLRDGRAVSPGLVAAGPRCSSLHARNCHQVLGADLASPARFVLCWTPDGSLDGRGRRVGGTGQALRIAHHHGIAVFNLARPEHVERVSRHCISPTR